MDIKTELFGFEKITNATKRREKPEMVILMRSLFRGREVITPNNGDVSYNPPCMARHHYEETKKTVEAYACAIRHG